MDMEGGNLDKRSAGEASVDAIDRYTGLDRLLYWRLYPSTLHYALFLVLAVLAFFAFFPERQAEGNLANEIVWKLWWPGLSFLVLLGGRIWCGVCPFGGLADMAARLGKPTGLPPAIVRKTGPWLGVVSVFLFGLAFLALGLEGNAVATGIILVGIAVLAFGLSLVYRGRNFCRYLCPVGMITRVYSFFSLIRVRGGGMKRRPQACPAGQSPASLLQPSQCQFCGVCTKKESPGIRTYTSRGEGGMLRLPTRVEFGPVEATLSVLLLGLMAADSVRMTPLFARFQQAALPYIAYNYRLTVIIGVSGLTALLLAASLLASRLLAVNGTEQGKVFRSLGFALLPLTLGVFMALALQHLWSGAWPSLQTIAAETRLIDWSGHMPPENVYFFSVPLKIVQFAILSIGLWFSLKLAGRLLPVASATVPVQASMSGDSRINQKPVVLLAAAGLGFLFLLPMSGAC